MSAPGFFDTLERQLGDQLERTVARRRARRRLVERVGAFGLGVVAVMATVFFVTNNDAAVADVSVQTRDGLVYLRLVDDEFDADEIQAAAAEAGIDLRVEMVPVGPSLVGRFVGATEEGGDLGVLKELDLDGPAFSGFVVPAGYDGTIWLTVGRPADGEPYRTLGNAVSTGEPLACSGALDATPSEVAAIAEQRGIDVTWIGYSPDGQRPIDVEEVAAGELDDLDVARAQSMSPDRVMVFLAEAGVQLPTLALTKPAAC